MRDLDLFILNPGLRQHLISLSRSLQEWKMVSQVVTLTSGLVDKNLWCDHSNKTSLVVLSHADIFHSGSTKPKFGNFIEFWLKPLWVWMGSNVYSPGWVWRARTQSVHSQPAGIWIWRTGSRQMATHRDQRVSKDNNKKWFSKEL